MEMWCQGLGRVHTEAWAPVTVNSRYWALAQVGACQKAGTQRSTQTNSHNNVKALDFKILTTNLILKGWKISPLQNQQNHLPRASAHIPAVGNLCCPLCQGSSHVCGVTFHINLVKELWKIWWKIPEGSGRGHDFPADAPVLKRKAWRLNIQTLGKRSRAPLSPTTLVRAATLQLAGGSCPLIYRLFPFPYENVTVHRQGHGLKYLLVNETCI